MKQERIKKVATLAVGLVLFVAALYILQGKLRQVHLHEVLRYLRSIPLAQIAQALALTLLSFIAQAGDEALLFRAIGHKQPLNRTALPSFISNAVSHSVGYSLLSGGSLRLWFYRAWGISLADVSQLVALHSVVFWLGFFFLSGISFVIDPLPLPSSLHLPLTTVRPLGFLFLLLVAAFFFLSWRRLRPGFGRWRIALPAPRASAVMAALSAADWIFAAGVLVVLLPPLPGRSLIGLLAIYLLAQIVGASSQVPGGLGVFESVFLVLLAPGVEAPAVIGALLAYRAIYYLLPLLGAATSLAVRQALPQMPRLKRFLLALGSWLGIVAPELFALLTLACGAVLLFSGATPAVASRLGLIQNVVPLPVLEIAHFMASLIGTGLIFLARGLQRRLARAYQLTLAFLAGGILLSLVKGIDYEEALFLAVLFGALLLFGRSAFYRRTSLASQAFSPFWIAAIVLILFSSIWLGVFSYKHIDYSHDLWWQFTFSGDAPRSLRATSGAVILAFLLVLNHLLRPGFAPLPLPAAADIERASPVIAASRDTLANLALLGDKALLFSASGDSFLMYSRVGRSWVAMGDPQGKAEEAGELIWKFRELVDQYDGWTVFYEVSRYHLHQYVDLGLAMFKLGEEAWVPLAEVSLEGRANKWFRHISHRLQEQGCRSAILPAAAVPARLAELRQVSDGWLQCKRTREKGFSLGSFNESYLQRFPLAVIIRGERILAFANIWAGSGGEEISVDLMRFGPGAPENCMDFLFVQLMLWGRENGFACFNLGMAPFSGLASESMAPLWNRFGAFLFQHGENFYNFQGLRRYKEKFRPVWEPRYLAGPGGIALPRVLANVSALVSKGMKGVIAK
ncbi:MAG TPA: bifunctional lysylphosphatidylglycerol flippase/synthetase MprF [Acidobacteriota bacterium]